MSAPADAALARAAQSGDTAALGILLERHRALLHAVAVGMLGHGAQAEDAVHDTFVIALRRIGSLREPAAARSWLLTILGNVCRAELRRPHAEPAAEVPEPGVDGAPVEEAIEAAALRDWIWTALERLSEPLRLVVVLRHFTSCNSYEAIAAICGVPVGTVRSRLSAGRAKLAAELLDTATEAHTDTQAYDRRGLDYSAAMQAFERTGDSTPLRELYAPDLAFALFDRVPRRGLDDYAARLRADFEDGVTSTHVRTIVGADLAVTELRLHSPPDQPLHCPPAMTQISFYDENVTRRIATHYAAITAS